MSENTVFKSRPAYLSCSTREFFSKVTDARNFSRFISTEVFTDLTVEKESLSFRANLLGTVVIHIEEKTEYSRVVYRGENSQLQDFTLTADISETETGKACVVFTLSAGLNPVLKMLAAAPINGFLETVVTRMEGFSDWNSVSQ